MSALLDALLGANRAEVEMNPWLNAAKGAASTDLSGYDMNPWTRALLQVGQGFSSGLMAGYGKKQVEEAQQNRASQIVDIMKNTTGKPLVDALQDVPGIKPYIGAIAIEQAANDAANRKELNKFLLEKQGMMLGDDNKVIQLFDPNAREIALAGGKKAAEIKAQIKAYSSGQSNNDVAVKPSLFGDYTPLATRRAERTRSYMAQGLTPNAAADQANKDFAVENIANKDAMEKLKTTREQAAALAQIAGQAEAGVRGAGQTGGILNFPRNVLSMALATIDPEEAQQRASQALLDAVKPEVMGVAKKPGSGATTDFESNMYIKSGPSSALTPQENQILIDNIRALAQIKREYSNFLENYINDKGDAVGADQAWEAYKMANPLLDKENNPIANRAPWQDFFAQAKTFPVYSVKQLQDEGYSPDHIQMLRLLGKVK